MVCASRLAIGFTKADISTRYLYAGGGISLLMDWVKSEIILIVGRWCSDTMICYLHMTANIFTKGIAIKVFQTAPIRSPLPCMLETSTKRHSRDLTTPNTRGFWGPGTVSVWSS